MRRLLELLHMVKVSPVLKQLWMLDVCLLDVLHTLSFIRQQRTDFYVHHLPRRLRHPCPALSHQLTARDCWRLDRFSVCILDRGVVDLPVTLQHPNPIDWYPWHDVMQEELKLPGILFRHHNLIIRLNIDVLYLLVCPVV